MNKQKIFSDAWSIARKASAKFGGSVKSYFAEALKMAYRESKLSVDYLVSIGGNEWVKNDYHRVYFNSDVLCKLIGLSFSTYKTGNISIASLNGHGISNSRASSIRSNLSQCKFWFDVKTGKFISSDLNDDLFETIVSSIN